MITTFFNTADIVYACSQIQAKEQQPIIYMSERQAKELTPIAGLPRPEGNNIYARNEGLSGKYYGIPVYVTDQVGDMIVIVPQYKEDI